MLAERHRQHRLREAALEARFEQPDTCRVEVEALWRRDGASGAVAERDGEVVSYVLGIPLDESTWGANVWVESAGHAARAAEDIRDAYAAAAARAAWPALSTQTLAPQVLSSSGIPST